MCIRWLIYCSWWCRKAPPICTSASGIPPDHPGAWDSAPGGRAAVAAGRHRRIDAQHHLRGPHAASAGKGGRGFRLCVWGSGAVSRERVQVQRGLRHCAAPDSQQDVDIGRNRPAGHTINTLLYKPRGLVLVTGPTGSGKTTTLASMINIINEQRDDAHIITIEDPIEYFHKHKKAIVTQREVHVDVPSFEEALRRALRQDPDVILVGELRDLETMEAADHRGGNRPLGFRHPAHDRRGQDDRPHCQRLSDATAGNHPHPACPPSCRRSFPNCSSRAATSRAALPPMRS